MDFAENEPSGGDAPEAAEEPVHVSEETVTPVPTEVDDSRMEILQNLQNAVKPAAPETESAATPEAADESVEIPETPEPEKNQAELDITSTQEDEKVL